MTLSGHDIFFSPFTTLCFQTQNPFLSKTLTFPISTSAFSILRSLSAASPHYRQHHHRRLLLRDLHALSPSSPFHVSVATAKSRTSDAPLCTSVEQLAGEAENQDAGDGEKWDSSTSGEVEGFDSDASFGATDSSVRSSASLEVKELDELPEQWRRSKLAWLCKELPSHKPAAVVRVLNGQRKWMTQEDATYVAVHCMRIRENETGFRVYKWMIQQHWYRFDHALVTKLADYMGKERKPLKCRELFNDIINQGQIPSESTFHILTVAYLSCPVQGFIEEACGIYNRMIQLGGYKPRLSLHNTLFKALVSQPGGTSKHYLKQAEFIFHNLETSGLEIHNDIYGGLIWLHSYQDTIDKERIASLRSEMQSKGIKENREVLVSILRACSKEGDVDETERTWNKIQRSEDKIPSQAFVYKMEVYARIGEPMKSLDIFREMQERLGSATVVAFHKVIEVLCRAQEIEVAESLMTEFINSGLKPLMQSYIELVDMYLSSNLHDKLESTFLQCLEKCRPNRTIYTIYLTSLVHVGNIEKAEEIYNFMYSNGAIGVSTRSCNTILKGYLSCGEFVKAEKIYDLMCEKKYDIDPPLMEKLEYVLSLTRKVLKRPIRLKLSEEQREILVGLLLGGLQIESDEEKRNHAIRFQFDENSDVHSVFKIHIYNQFHEWLASFSKPADGSDDVIPSEFCTISHSYFGFYADQFWPRGQNAIPKLIHRWLTPRVLAYWYLYSGYRTSSGDVLLKVKGSKEGVDRIVKTLKMKSLECRVKRKGRVFWLGFLGSNSTWFWKLVEPFILDDLKDLLKAGGGQFFDGRTVDDQSIDFDSGSDSDENISHHSESDS